MKKVNWNLSKKHEEITFQLEITALSAASCKGTTIAHRNNYYIDRRVLGEFCVVWCGFLVNLRNNEVLIGREPMATVKLSLLPRQIVFPLNIRPRISLPSLFLLAIYMPSNSLVHQRSIAKGQKNSGSMARSPSSEDLGQSTQFARVLDFFRGCPEPTTFTKLRLQSRRFL